MRFNIEQIGSIKGKKTTVDAKTSKTYPASVAFRASFVTSEFDKDLGFTVDKENNIEFKVECADAEVSKVGSALEAIKKEQLSGKNLSLNFSSSFPSYGDYKSVYSSIINSTALDFIKELEAALKQK